MNLPQISRNIKTFTTSEQSLSRTFISTITQEWNFLMNIFPKDKSPYKSFSPMRTLCKATLPLFTICRGFIIRTLTKRRSISRIVHNLISIIPRILWTVFSTSFLRSNRLWKINGGKSSNKDGTNMMRMLEWEPMSRENLRNWEKTVAERSKVEKMKINTLRNNKTW